MKFHLIDNIIEFDSGTRIVATKAVSISEEYLADHFPSFPILPGVMMLEAMTEAARWLILEKMSFEPRLILLKEAKNVTYKNFVKPGQILKLEVECKSISEIESSFSAKGLCDSNEMVRARFTMIHKSVTHDKELHRSEWSEKKEQKFQLLTGKQKTLVS